MKKKLLSLFLAGAMVATTSVSAFADVTNIVDPDNTDGQADVTITGIVLNDNGDQPTGTFNVTIPTSASFTVRKDKSVISVPITITNNGAQNIDVYADKFIDVTKNSGITVVQATDLQGHDRTNVSLSLKGKSGLVHLKSEEDNNSNNGIYKDSELQTKANTDNDSRLTTIAKGTSEQLTLQGNAGDQNPTNSASDNFTLRLKIKKSANQ